MRQFVRSFLESQESEWLEFKKNKCDPVSLSLKTYK